MKKQLNGCGIGRSRTSGSTNFLRSRPFSPQTIRTAVEEPVGKDLVLEINSGGGSVFAGFGNVLLVLRSAGCRTVAEVQS